MPKTAMIRRGLAAFALSVIAAASITACGSSSSTASSSTRASSAGAASAAGGTSSDARYQARLNLARCYRSQGINVPDPAPGGGHAAGAGTEQILSQYPQAQVQAARQACRQYIAQANPMVNANSAGVAQMEQSFLKFAKCMRANGVPKFPDRMQDVEAAFQSGALSMNSPAFQSAMQSCQQYAAAVQQGMGH